LRQVATVYQLVLRDRFGLLHPTLQRFLGDERGGRASGRLKVTRSAGRLRNFVATTLGLPPAGEYDMALEVTSHAGCQHWLRRFGNHRLETTQAEYRGLLVEALGPGSIGFALAVVGGALLFRPCRAWLFGIPLPLCLAPGITAGNWPAEAGGWRVRVDFRVPLLGSVGDYEGDVRPAGEPADT
jgi:Domain of unknown function (DUF4166)